MNKVNAFKIGIVKASDLISTKYSKMLESKLKIVSLDDKKNSANLILVIGGDGTMLHAVHKYMHLDIPFYGINTGQLGFLMNNISLQACKDAALISKKLSNVEEVSIFPLEMTVHTTDNKKFTRLAVNEVSLLRQTSQTAKIEIFINDKLCLESLISDGVMVATPAGSSAYNLSAGGQILPIDSNLLALTPISPFRPRRWRGALLRNNAKITFQVLSPKIRSVSAVADFVEIRNAARVEIKSLSKKRITLLFDKDQSFNSRVIKEQFLH